MPDLTNDVSKLGWVPFGSPRDAAHHAHAAWLHTGTRAVLMLLWFGSERNAGQGKFEWEVRVRGGYHRKYLPEVPTVPDLCDALQWADRAVEELSRISDADNL